MFSHHIFRRGDAVKVDGVTGIIKHAGEKNCVVRVLAKVRDGERERVVISHEEIWATELLELALPRRD